MPSAFVSYSHEDREIVESVVRLMNSHPDFRDAVLSDADFRPGGGPWFEQMRDAVRAVPVVYVFWCCHSKPSPQVKTEMAFAASEGKTIILVLIDHTLEFPEEVGVDLTSVVKHRPCGPPRDELIGDRRPRGTSLIGASTTGSTWVWIASALAATASMAAVSFGVLPLSLAVTCSYIAIISGLFAWRSSWGWQGQGRVRPYDHGPPVRSCATVRSVV